jgi:hypothetical protein
MQLEYSKVLVALEGFWKSWPRYDEVAREIRETLDNCPHKMPEVLKELMSKEDSGLTSLMDEYMAKLPNKLVYIYIYMVFRFIVLFIYFLFFIHIFFLLSLYNI